MAYASLAGRARTDPSHPRAHGICDRCGFRYNLKDLNYQFEWRGPALRNIRLKVCYRCMDQPAEQLRPIIPGPDPVPVQDPRPEPAAALGIAVANPDQHVEPPVMVMSNDA